MNNLLFEPVYNLLEAKRDYFRLFGKSAKYRKSIYGNNNQQCKMEDWVRGELMYLFHNKGWKPVKDITIEEGKLIDLALCHKDCDNKIFIEIKEYVNSGRDPKTSKEYRPYTTNDLGKIKKFAQKNNIGLFLLLLPRNNDIDCNKGYSKYFYQKIKNDFKDIHELYSRKIIYDNDGDYINTNEEGFWVSWWSYDKTHKTEYQELLTGYP